MEDDLGDLSLDDSSSLFLHKDYSLLEDHGYRKPHARLFPAILRPISNHILTICLTSLIWWLSTPASQPECSYQLPSTKIIDCGHSTDEARALGCQFDVLAYHWIPQLCFDNETNNEYQKKGSWLGYSDKEGTDILDLAGMSERTDLPYYTSAREHVSHCAYTWRRQYKLFAKGGLYMDFNSLSYNHTIHCTEILMKYAEADPKDYDEIGASRTTVGFSTCEVES
jgi:hypothetical protein